MVVGPVTFVDGELVVSGYVIAPAGAFRPSTLEEGDVVIITGILLPDGQTIQARLLEYFEDPEATPEPEQTPEATDTPEATPGATETPEATPELTETPEPTNQSCDRPDHPVAQQLADAFAVGYDEIISWHCAGFGFGEIARAYLLAEQTGEAPSVYFDLKSSDLGWGQIVRDAGMEGWEHSLLAPSQVGNGHDRGGNGFGNGNGQGQGNEGQGNWNGQGGG